MKRREPVEEPGKALPHAADIAIGGTNRPHPAGEELRLFVWELAAVIGAAGLVFAVAQVAQVMLLIFAGLLLAIFLMHIVGYLRRWTHLPHGIALLLVLFCLVVVAVGLAWMFGTLAVTEYGQLSTAITNAYAALPETLRSGLTTSTDIAAWVGRLRSVVPPVLFGLADLLIVIFSGIYFAASPQTYHRGLVLLVPPRGQRRAREVLHVIGEAFWLWLIGQFCSMLLVGTLTAIGLWLVGLAVPIQLGLLSGLLEFVPYVGPVVAAAPGLLIAFTHSPVMALWVLGVYVVVQQAEGHLIQPLVQRAVVEIPPVVTIAAIAAGGALFGILGIMLATPLAIALMVIVNMLYLDDRLGEGRHFPAEDKVSEEAPGPAS